MSVRLIPSSSEDLTFASITSETNGRNTTILNVTIEKEINVSPAQMECEGAKRTFVPKTPISVSYLPLPDLDQIKYGNAQPDVVQNLVGINGVDLANKRLICGDTELVRFNRDGVLPEITRLIVLYGERGGELAHLDDGEDKHPGPNPQSNHKFSLVEYITPWEAGVLFFR